MFSNTEIQMLNELELDVYNYIAANQQQILYMSIRELASASHVSTSTVLRFCKKMGCDGYSEFKVEFKHYIASLSTTSNGYDASEITNFFHYAFTDSFQAEIDTIADYLGKSTCLIFIGVGNSACTAQYAARYFSNAGKFSLHISDPFHPVDLNQDMDTIIVAISVSGETPETLYLANKFKLYGCPLVSITMSKNCTLARISNHNLNCYVTVHKNKTNDLTTQVPILFLIEQLGLRQSKYLKNKT